MAREQAPLVLGEALGVPLSTATRIVDWQVKNGYAQRLSDPDDRRIVRVALTAEGRGIYATIDAFLRERVKGILRRFTAAERVHLVALLGKLMDVLREGAT